jgi:hypothetical protein
MRLVRVIIKLESRRNLVEFLLANNLGLSWPRRAVGAIVRGFGDWTSEVVRKRRAFLRMAAWMFIAYSVGILVIFLGF